MGGGRARDARLSPEFRGGLSGFYRELREAHDRTAARWPAAPWMLARAFAKRMLCQEGFHESHSRARCVARARIRAPSASVCK